MTMKFGMEDDGLSIQLNICNNIDNISHSLPKRKRHKELTHTETSKSTSQSQDASSSHKKTDQRPQKQDQPVRKKRRAEESETQDKRQKGSHVIASLFKHNPDIPHINRTEVVTLKEDIFSAASFHDLPLHPFMAITLEEKLGFTTMTAVQQQTIPHVLNGRDVLVKSQTGSGKTLAYAVPIVHDLQSQKPKLQRSDGVHAVVVVPTRELALQTVDIFEKILRPFVWVVPGCLMGGEKKKAEKARIRKGINILICTPGRFLDHVETTSSLELSRVKYLVIDEADRMLDMGFEKDVSKIISALNDKKTNRQTILLSATLSSGVENLAGMTLTNPVKVNLGNDTDKNSISTEENSQFQSEKSFTVPQQLKQHFVTVPSKLRLVTLAAFILLKCLHGKKRNKMIVFLSTQDSVEFHHNLLLNTVCEGDGEADLLLYKLHGDMPQKDRTKVYQEFIATETGVLLCTDVAARGLHLPAIQWIVQYNPPGSPTDYIHRVGRTARAGTSGQSLLFLTPDEVKYVETLGQMKISLQEMAVTEILKSLQLEAANLVRNRDSQDKRIPGTVEECATALQDVFERYIYSNKTTTERARKAYASFIRAYATFPSSLKHIFHVKTLHLGHVAKSYGLREAPSHIAGKVIKGLSHRAKKNKNRLNLNRSDIKKKDKGNLSEFASGSVSVKLPQKKRKLKKKKRT